MPYSAATNIFVRADADDANGGGFDYTVSSPGDSALARQTAPVLIVDGSTYTATCTAAVVTISGTSVSTAWRGLTINLITAPGGTPGRYTISDVNTGTNTLTLTQTTGMSGGACTLRVGGAIRTVGQVGAVMAAGNLCWLMSAGGLLDITNTTANVAGGRLSLTTAASGDGLISAILGCTSDRYDGGRPTVRLQINLGASNAITFNASTGGVVEGIDFDGGAFTTAILCDARVLRRCTAVGSRAANSLLSGLTIDDCYAYSTNTTDFGNNAIRLLIGSITRSVARHSWGVGGRAVAPYNIGTHGTFALRDSILWCDTNSTGGLNAYGGDIDAEGCLFYRSSWALGAGGTTRAMLARRSLFHSCPSTVFGTVSLANHARIENVAYWSCGTKRVTAHWPDAARIVGEIDLAADPLVNAANRDFRLTTAAKAVLQQAWSHTMRGLTPSHTLVRDIHPVEEAIVASGGGADVFAGANLRRGRR